MYGELVEVSLTHLFKEKTAGKERAVVMVMPGGCQDPPFLSFSQNKENEIEEDSCGSERKREGGRERAPLL